MNAYTYMWGFEKTFDQGNGSIGMRLPLNSLTATSPDTSISAPTSTALGNLDIFAKYILKQNYRDRQPDHGRVPDHAVDGDEPVRRRPVRVRPQYDLLPAVHRLPLEARPVLPPGLQRLRLPGQQRRRDLDVQRHRHGLFRLPEHRTRSRLITAIAPTFEVHVNTPFNHRNPYNTFDPAASAYVTNLTYGLNVMFYGRSMLTAALVTPVSSPKPFDAEFALLFNYYFGRTVRAPRRSHLLSSSERDASQT